jgi:hypothetical protein
MFKDLEELIDDPSKMPVVHEEDPKHLVHDAPEDWTTQKEKNERLFHEIIHELDGNPPQA